MTAIDREAIVRLAQWVRDGAPFDPETWGQHQDQLDSAADALLALVPEPADDEREALANLIPLNLVGDRNRPGFPADVFEAADRILAAGYRKVQ